MKLQVEIPLLLLFISFMLSDPIFTNLVIYRTCYVTLKYNESECALLGTQFPDNFTNHLETLVQPHANVIFMTKNFTEAFLNVCFCLLLGPWSDKFGRKPVLLTTQFGFVIGALVLALYSTIPFLSPWWVLLSSISLLFGGVGSFLSVAICYISDKTSDENRGVRMGVFEVMLSLGMLLGKTLSSYTFNGLGYTASFLLCSGMIFIAFLYTIFRIAESVTSVQTEGRIRGLFKFEHIKDMIQTVAKRRDNYDRLILISLIILVSIFILTVNDSGILTMFLRSKFGWSLRKYTLFSSYSSLVWIIGTLFSVFVLHKWLRIPETVLIVIGFISMMNPSLVYGLATADWHIYFGASTKLLAGSLSPMIKSLTSKLVSLEEVGKIFALMTVMETCVGMVSSVLYTSVYNATINTHPETFNFMTAGFYLFEVFFTLFIIWLRGLRRNHVYGPINEDTSSIDYNSS